MAHSLMAIVSRLIRGVQLVGRLFNTTRTMPRRRRRTCIAEKETFDGPVVERTNVTV